MSKSKIEPCHPGEGELPRRRGVSKWYQLKIFNDEIESLQEPKEASQQESETKSAFQVFYVKNGKKKTVRRKNPDPKGSGWMH